MQPADTQWSTLVAFDALAACAARAVEARAQTAASGMLLFRFVLRGEISRIRIPSAKSVERADDLWKHTCFEAFVRESGAATYHELNFAPSRHWAAYRFDDYRAGGSSPRLESPPDIAVRRTDDRLEVDASVSLHDLMQRPVSHSLQIGLSAVIEGDDGRLSYWALKHAAGKPDFHAAAAFALELLV